jgi:hypothetical protein
MPEQARRAQEELENRMHGSTKISAFSLEINWQ